jgi:hypothetical protein
MDVPLMMLLQSCVHGTACLPNVDLATLTGDAVYSRCPKSQIIFDLTSGLLPARPSLLRFPSPLTMNCSMWPTRPHFLSLYSWLLSTGTQSAATCSRWFLARGFSILKMEAIRSSETSVCTRTTWRHIPKNAFFIGTTFQPLLFLLSIADHKTLLFVLNV